MSLASVEVEEAAARVEVRLEPQHCRGGGPLPAGALDKGPRGGYGTRALVRVGVRVRVRVGVGVRVRVGVRVGVGVRGRIRVREQLECLVTE